MMKIYIPSLKRADKQTTLSKLSKKLLARTSLVINHDAKAEYAAAAKTYGVGVVVCPKSVNSSCTVREFIVKQHDISNGPSLIMLDDDLRFFKRRTDDPTKFVPSEGTDLEVCFATMERLMRTYAHGGILAREGGNRDAFITPTGTKENTRLLRALAYDVNVIREHRIKFNRGAMEDFDVELQLLRLGYKSVALCSYVQDQIRSNAPGGCSVYRTPEYQAAWCRQLKELHPDFVTLVEKETKVAWNGLPRTDVSMQWKKAFESWKGEKR